MFFIYCEIFFNSKVHKVKKKYRNRKDYEITFKRTDISVEKQKRNTTEQFKKIETFMVANYIIKLITD